VRIDEATRLWFEGRGAMKKTGAGEFYSDERVQTALEANTLISAVPTGEGYPCIGALIFLDPPSAKKIAGPAPEGVDPLEFWAKHPAILAAVKAAVADANAALLAGPHALKWEQVRKWTIVPKELTVENGLRTNTLKPKNKLVRKEFDSYTKEMYASNART
jgi:long-chain acyl-CoA synthetase